MSHLPWKPIRLRNLEQQIDQAFDELIHGQWGICPPSGKWQPEIDIFETPDYYLVEADVPGVDPDEIHVTGCIEQSAQGIRIERRQGSFVRRIPLEQPVDPFHVKRENQAGILRLQIPKQKLSPPA